MRSKGMGQQHSELHVSSRVGEIYTRFGAVGGDGFSSVEGTDGAVEVRQVSEGLAASNALLLIVPRVTPSRSRLRCHCPCVTAATSLAQCGEMAAIGRRGRARRCHAGGQRPTASAGRVTPVYSALVGLSYPDSDGESQGKTPTTVSALSWAPLHCDESRCLCVSARSVADAAEHQ